MAAKVALEKFEKLTYKRSGMAFSRAGMNKKKLVKQLFDQGNYTEIIALSGEEPSFFVEPEVRLLLIASLCLTNRRIEAEELDFEGVNRFGRDYFIGVALTREGSYRDALRLFQRSRRQLRKSDSPLSSFFALQGIGFFKFFTGNYDSLIEVAEKAYRSSLKTSFRWGRLMALDLLAHGLVVNGRIHEGMAVFDRALSKARLNKALSLASGISVSIACYRSQYSINPVETLQSLSQERQNLKDQSVVSQNAIGLEIFRQLIIQGDFQKARSFYDRLAPQIYRNKNPRHVSTLLLRYSYMLSLLGSDHEAHALLQSARLNLNEEIDVTHLQRITGLSGAIAARNGIKSDANGATANISEGSWLNRRISHRQENLRFVSRNKHEDPLGDLLDLARSDRAVAIQKLAQAELWGLIPSALGWHPRSSILVLDVNGSRGVSFVDSVCRWTKRGLEGNPRKIIELFRLKPSLSKSEMIEGVWGYSYDGARHDKLIHNTINLLNRQIGSPQDFVSWDNDQYRIKGQVVRRAELSQVTFVRSGLRAEEKRKTSEVVHLQDWRDLNWRQIRLIEEGHSAAGVTVRSYKKTFAVSHMTAFRDLSGLVETNYLVKVGQGRATCYVKSPKTKALP